MKYRKLRIAWSVAWGIVCLLLVILWVRSDRWRDTLVGNLTNRHACGVASAKGRIHAMWMWYPQPHFEPLFCESADISMYKLSTWLESYPFWTYGLRTIPGMPGDIAYSLTLPYWISIMFSVAIGVAPWVQWQPRFRLCTLLIAITLVAVGLGWVVYALRN